MPDKDMDRSNFFDDSKELIRQKAEEIIFSKKMQVTSKLKKFSGEEMQRIIHELEVHQIELEMQNEELQKAHAELELVKTCYVDLYNSAPVGYCTLNYQGLILEANLTASDLLGISQKELLEKKITRFIFNEDQDIYYFYNKEIFEPDNIKSCELRMVKKDGTKFWAQLSTRTAISTDGNIMYRVTISDTTQRKEADDLRIKERS